MICRTRLRAATALAAFAPLAFATPASAGLFGRKPAAAAPTAPPASAGKTAAGAEAASARPAKATAAQRATVERMDPLARAAFWANEAQLDPADLDASVRMASALRGLGRYDEATAACDKVLVTDPNQFEALLEAGRSRIAAQQGFYAIAYLTRAATLAPRDWRPHSLMGVAMEQTKRSADARVEYARALQLSPENPAVLSNLALLSAAEGDRATAEALLRRAVAQPGAMARERQNLALVLGLSGKVAEAEQLIRRDLPPELADGNVAYLRAVSPAK